MRPPAGDPGDATTADWPCRQIPTRATTRPGDELAPEAPPADPGARLVAVGPPTDQQRFQAAVVGPLLEQLLDPARALATGPLLLAEGGVVPPTARNARPLDVQAEPTHDRRPPPGSAGRRRFTVADLHQLLRRRGPAVTRTERGVQPPGETGALAPLGTRPGAGAPAAAAPPEPAAAAEPGVAPPGDGRLDVIVRTVPGRLPYLVDALYSIAGQQHPGVRALVMVHSADAQYLAAVQALVARLEGLLQAVVVPVPEAGGPAVPLNRAMAQTTAEFISVLDDDDVYYPLFASTLVRHLQAHAELTLVYGIGRRVHGRATPEGFLFERRGDEFAMPFEVSRLAYENFIPPCTMVLRRADIERAGLRWDEGLAVLEDWAFLRALAAEFRGAFVPVPVAEYRTREGSTQAITSDRAVWQRTGALLLARGRDQLLRAPAHELADLHQRHLAAELRLAEALGRMGHLEQKAAAHDGELAALRAEHRAVLGSRSWRITRLLRRLVRSRLPDKA